jgi:serine acetyltransferase
MNTRRVTTGEELRSSIRARHPRFVAAVVADAKITARYRSELIINPWVTIGLRAGDFRGPSIGRHVQIGTGAKIIGPVTVGDNASIGANAVVVHDVPPRTTVVGAPARPRGQ